MGLPPDAINGGGPRATCSHQPHFQNRQMQWKAVLGFGVPIKGDGAIPFGGLWVIQSFSQDLM